MTAADPSTTHDTARVPIQVSGMVGLRITLRDTKRIAAT